MSKKICALVLLLIVSVGMIHAQKATYKNVNAAEFKTLIETKKGTLIDLRTPDETKKGKIKGAEEIDFLATDFESKLDKLDKKQTYYIYCAGGGRSSDCAQQMIDKGFTNVINLQKGFSEWAKMGYEVEKK
ncbi:MAG: rhodanese-like protein [Bacteroidetes bacterium]|jgi:rhodanese-related sulfurtransferase|nr:rhodanese-like protein [Bacteroidota bacterium]